jgi:hypothetical protein
MKVQFKNSNRDAVEVEATKTIKKVKYYLVDGYVWLTEKSLDIDKNDEVKVSKGITKSNAKNQSQKLSNSSRTSRVSADVDNS